MGKARQKRERQADEIERGGLSIHELRRLENALVGIYSEGTAKEREKKRY